MKSSLLLRVLTVISGAILLVFAVLLISYKNPFMRSAPSEPQQSSSSDYLSHPTGSSPDVDTLFTKVDTLIYEQYTIIRSMDLVDSANQVYSVVIQKGERIVFHLESGVDRRDFNNIGLLPVLGNHSKQLLIEQYSGGAHCCYSYWLLDLRDSIHTLFRSNDYPELGYELALRDLDKDGKLELLQSIIAFDYFNRLPHSSSPFSTAVFKLSPDSSKFILASREFAHAILGDTTTTVKELQAMVDSTDFSKFDDSYGEYLQQTLNVWIDFAYAGKRDRGQILFDQFYRLQDKQRIMKEVHKVFERSRIYRELYAEGGGA